MMLSVSSIKDVTYKILNFCSLKRPPCADVFVLRNVDQNLTVNREDA